MDNESTIMEPELEKLYLQTPGSRGPDGTERMLSLRNNYYIRVSNRLQTILEVFWEGVRNDPRQNILVDFLINDLQSLDESCIIPRPEMITSPKQCDDLIWELNNGLARVGRIWTVAITALSLVEYELSVIEKWLKEKFVLDDARRSDSKIGVMLAKEKRYVNKLKVLSTHAERLYKRIETQLPSLRDLSERRYQESRYRQTGETG